VKYEATFSDHDFNTAVFSARRSPDRCHFRLVECTQCGMIYSDPATDPAALAGLYETGRVTYGDLEAQIYASYAPVLDRALSGLDQRRAFVEIGGGRGFMLRYGAEHGFAEQIEIEPSSDAESRFEPPSAQARFLRGVFAPGVLPGASASLVCFFQVLDHIPNPRSFLEEVFAVLQPGGVAVCVTHDTRAMSARLLGERSPIFDIEHTYLFHKGNLPELFRRTGFDRVESFGVSNRYALRYWLHLAPAPARLKRLALGLFQRMRLADVPIRLAAGNFGVIARKPH
jgi:SAM-dependent methyltransferase